MGRTRQPSVSVRDFVVRPRAGRNVMGVLSPSQLIGECIVKSSDVRMKDGRSSQ